MRPLLLVLLLGLPFSASAEGWTVDELSSQPDRPTCMTRAENTFHSFVSQHGGGNVVRNPGRDDWTVAGYDLAGKSIDGLIICPIEGSKVEPFLIVFDSGTEDQLRGKTAQRLRAIWDTQR